MPSVARGALLPANRVSSPHSNSRSNMSRGLLSDMDPPFRLPQPPETMDNSSYYNSSYPTIARGPRAALARPGAPPPLKKRTAAHEKPFAPFGRRAGLGGRLPAPSRSPRAP